MLNLKTKITRELMPFKERGGERERTRGEMQEERC